MKSTRFAVVLAGCGLLAAAPCRAQRAQPQVTVIAGTLLGADGAPMKLAEVFVWQGSNPRGATHSLVGPDGRFAIATQYTGPLMIEFTGVDHNATTVPLLVDRAQTIGMDVRLKHYEYTDSLDRITAIGDFNQFGFGTGKPLVKQPDGRYTLDVETTADTLAYQLLGLTKEQGHSINGPQAGRWYYDNGGDYKNVIRAKDGHATIVFDPASLQKVPGDVQVTFRDPASLVARTWHLLHAWDLEETAYFDSSRAARARHDSLHFDMTPALRRLRAALAAERVPLLRQLLLGQLVEASSLADKPDTATARRLIAEVPPSSPWYGALGGNALNATFNAYRIVYGHKREPGAPPDTALSRRLLGLYQRLLAVQTDSNQQAELLYMAAATARGLHDDAKANDYYTRLITGYPDAGITNFAKSQLDPNRVLRVGAKIPDFRFVSLDDSTVTYTRASMTGKTYLLDFWATWCGPCVGEMRFLQAAHDTLAPLGVEFLSVSLDQKADDVRAFRHGEWKMPWLHAFAAGGFDNAEVKRMEIFGIPRDALVDKDGTILAVDARGETLTADIRHALQPAAPAAPATP